MFSKSRDLAIMKKKSPVAMLFIMLLRIYKLIISPWLPNACRFYPTCSVYAVDAVTKHGAVKGSFLAVKRVLRCNPFFEGGYDPVP
ncbi:MAG: membrane protein insertion efficiency factor YidD [Spirochaetota bacterium]